MSNYFSKATDKLSTVSYPFEVHDAVFNRMLGYLGYVRMNLAEENEATLSYLDDMVAQLLSIMQMSSLSVPQKIDMYHEMAHALAEQHMKLSSGEMPTDNLWFPGCVSLL